MKLVEEVISNGILTPGYKGDSDKYDVDMKALKLYIKENGCDRISLFGAYLAGRFNK